MSTPQEVIVDCSQPTARPTMSPLTGQDLTDYSDRMAAYPAAAAAVAAAQANLATLQQKVQGALANNVAYLAIAGPTTTQIGAQVAALTRQQNALARIIAGLLTDLSGT